MADGWIIVGTKLSTDKFDKQIADLEKKIKKEEEKAQIKLEAKLEAENELQKHKESIREVEQEYEKTSKQIEYIQGLLAKKTSGTYLTPKEVADVSSYDQVKEKNEEIGNQLDGMYDKQGKLKRKVDQTANAYNDVKNNVVEYKTKIESIKLQKHQAQINSIKDGIKKLNSNIGNSIKSIGRMALGFLSVASAYRLLSSASSTLAQYDKQYATNLEYIRYLLAQVLAPVLQFIVNMAGTLLSYLNYIVQAWFKIPLFAKDAAKSFEKARNSTSKIKKDLQTTSFDEMNILSDTSSTAGGGTVAPSIDTTQIAGEVPDWLQWIVDNKELIFEVMGGILGFLVGWKLNLEAIKALGIGVMIMSIIYLIQSLLEYLNDPSWENFGKVIQGIGGFILGLGMAIGQTPVIVAGAIILIIGTIIKYWEQIKAFLQNCIDWLLSKADWVEENFGIVGKTIYLVFVNMLQELLNSFDELLRGIKDIFDGIIKLVKGVFTGDWEMAWEGIKQIFKGVFESLWVIAKTPINLIIAGLNTLIDGANKIKFDVPDWVPGIGGKKFGFNIPKIPRLAKGTILNAPGKGVPVAGGTALAGEAGREAYLPLSDSQLLEELGATIGKYITINANIINKMNGRVISREIQKVQNDSDFAYNG